MSYTQQHSLDQPGVGKLRPAGHMRPAEYFFWPAKNLYQVFSFANRLMPYKRIINM